MKYFLADISAIRTRRDSFDDSNEASPASQVRPGEAMAGGRMDTSGRARARSAVREDLLLEQES